MWFEKREVNLKDGRICVLRPAEPDDSIELIQYLKQTAGETTFLLKYPEEWNLTEERERELLQGILENSNSTMMVAIIDGEVAGNSSVNPVGNARRVLHRCGFAIALKKAYWNLGIGTAMIKYQSELAKQIGYEQIELEYVEENKRAKALYEKCGFVSSGKRIKSNKYDDGTYSDDIFMTKFL